MLKHTTVSLTALLVLGFSITARTTALGAENMAIHKKVTVSSKANYRLTKDRSPQQLTDGYYASKRGAWNKKVKHQTSNIWVAKGCLTWSNRNPIVITIDLGQVQPISGLIYSTAGGAGGIGWPQHIYIATSNDGKIWHYAGDLVKLTDQTGRKPPENGYANFRYKTDDLKTHGRFVAIGIQQRRWAVCDEVEVLKGSDALLKQSAGKIVPPMKILARNMVVTNKVQNSLSNNISSIKKLIKKSSIHGNKKEEFLKDLSQAQEKIDNLTILSHHFKNIIPLSSLQRNILSIHGKALKARGFDSLVLWKIHRYAYVPLVNIPTKKYQAQIKLSVLQNEIRSDSLLLTNATGQSKTIAIKLNNPPVDAKPSWLKIAHAIWIDSFHGLPIQNALMPMKLNKGSCILKIPAGITAKLWLTIDSSKLKPGNYSSTLKITSHSKQFTAPVQITVSPVKMEKPDLAFYVWDYTNHPNRGLTKENMAQALALLKSHFVNVPWATSSVLPKAKAKDFDENNQLIKKLNFSRLDQWAKKWPDAKYYVIFYSVRRHGRPKGVGRNYFAGAKMGTDKFRSRVGAWAKAIATHWKKLDLDPAKLVLLTADEPNGNEDDRYMIEWNSAIKAGAPNIKIFSDPAWKDPRESKYYPENLRLPDILSPHSGQEYHPEIYQKLKNKYNKQLWFYNSPNFNYINNPQTAYRQQAWRVFAAGGTGMGIWAFADIKGTHSSWNTYTAVRPANSAVFVDQYHVYDSITWDSTREGVEDYQLLSMLKDAIKKSEHNHLKNEAQYMLNSAIQKVNSYAKSKGYNWETNINPFVVDKQISRVRNMLERMDR